MCRIELLQFLLPKLLSMNVCNGVHVFNISVNLVDAVFLSTDINCNAIYKPVTEFILLVLFSTSKNSNISLIGKIIRWILTSNRNTIQISLSYKLI